MCFMPGTATCLDAGGTLSGEHGIGIEKAHFMDLQFQPQDLAKMTDLKALFDPSHLANPGKIFPVRAGCGETSLGLRHAQLTAAASAGEESLWI
jgi:glycolate oxidase